MIEDTKRSIACAVAPYAFNLQKYFHNDEQYCKNSPFTSIETAAKDIERRHKEEIEKVRKEERERCTDIIAAHCSFTMENSKSEELRNYARSLANRLYTVITNPDE